MWGVFAKLQASVKKVGIGFYQINLPDRIVLFTPSGNLVLQYNFTKENITGSNVVKNSRMVPVITKNDVIYIPIIFRKSIWQLK